MSDFFKQDLSNALNPTPATPAPEPQPSTIKLGDKEYTQEDLQKAVGAWSMVQELEEKWDTKIDKVYPKFTQAATRVKELEEENEKLKTKPAPAYSADADIPEETKQEAIKAARKLGLLTKDDIAQMGYMSKTEVDSYIQERENAKVVLDRMRGLEKEIDGKDGRPAFETEKVLDFMYEKHLTDPEIAYKLMNEKALDAWKDKKIDEAKKPGLYTETSSSIGTKLPPEVKITKENRTDLLRAALEGR